MEQLMERVEADAGYSTYYIEADSGYPDLPKMWTGLALHRKDSPDNGDLHPTVNAQANPYRNSYFSHKINDPAMRYEFRVSTLGGEIVWVCV
jgi:hypothetical protein